MTDITKSDRVLVGPVTRNSKAQIVVDFPAGDTDGLALDVAATPASGNNTAAIKLGDFTLGNDVFGNGATNFGIKDADGTLVFSAEPGADKLTDTQAIAAFAAVTALAGNTAAAAIFLLYHMETDKQGLDLLTPIDGTTPTDAVFWARANALQAAFALHFAGVGGPHEFGEHMAADTAAAETLAAVPAATNTATACTLAIAIGAALIDHADQSGVHFTNDDVAAGYTPTSDLLAGNATKALCVTELDALLAAMLVHFAAGVYEIPA